VHCRRGSSAGAVGGAGGELQAAAEQLRADHARVRVPGGAARGAWRVRLLLLHGGRPAPPRPVAVHQARVVHRAGRRGCAATAESLRARPGCRRAQGVCGRALHAVGHRAVPRCARAATGAEPCVERDRDGSEGELRARLESAFGVRASWRSSTPGRATWRCSRSIRRGRRRRLGSIAARTWSRPCPQGWAAPGPGALAGDWPTR
jgi:hypothetical protein